VFILRLVLIVGLAAGSLACWQFFFHTWLLSPQSPNRYEQGKIELKNTTTY
jgi:hypothetical protein